MRTEIRNLQKVDHEQQVNLSLRIAGIRKEEQTAYGEKIQLLLCAMETASPATCEDEDLILLNIFQYNSLKPELKSELKCGAYIGLIGAKIFGHIEGRKTISFGASNYGTRIKVSSDPKNLQNQEGCGQRERPQLFDRSSFRFDM
eukprot:GHVS01054829.1.p1 GENE.GHVS01054829.1~~GHVS01054829.1.p1  ORF type:complete len:145 (+),score=8.44 GHVS01054829.1:292-726(+)